MCVLYVSLGSKVRPKTFGGVAMGSVVLFILRSILLLYYVGSGVNRVQIDLFGFSMRLFCFVQVWFYVFHCCTRVIYLYIECGIDPVPNKHRIITNLISANVYEHVEDCTDFQSVIDNLDNLFVKSHNVIFARHLLSTRRQQSGETLNQFLQDLRKLSKYCKFKAVTAEQYREELIRDTFINGLFSPAIRQRLLESDTLSLQTAYNKANSLDLVQKMQIHTQCIVPILLLLVLFLSHLLSLMILSPPPWQLHIPGGRSVIFVVVHIIIGEFVQLAMHVVITVIRKDFSGKFVVQTPMQAQHLLSMRILVQ